MSGPRKVIYVHRSDSDATLLTVDVGLISSDRGLVDFFANVFELDETSPLDTPMGTIYRLQLGTGALKFLVPTESPASGYPIDPFFSITGLRYLTFRVRHLDPVLDRVLAHGGRVRSSRREIRSGVFLVTAEDPDGNMIEIIEDHSISASPP